MIRTNHNEKIKHMIRRVGLTFSRVMGVDVVGVAERYVSRVTGV